ncbi:MAG: hypothetical protein HN467_11930, partial [Opitutae bacterium]|nr:hypothetical protein [Opitutae bacterium]
HNVVVIELWIGPVVDGRGHEHDLRPLSLRLLLQELHALLVLGEAFLIEWHVNAAVDPVAGDDEVGLQGLQRTAQALVQVGTREPVPDMPRLGQTGYRFARYALVHHLRAELGMVDRQPPFEKNNVLTSVGDAVSKENERLDVLEEFKVIVCPCTKWNQGENITKDWQVRM